MAQVRSLASTPAAHPTPLAQDDGRDATVRLGFFFAEVFEVEAFDDVAEGAQLLELFGGYLCGGLAGLAGDGFERLAFLVELDAGLFKQGLAVVSRNLHTDGEGDGIARAGVYLHDAAVDLEHNAGEEGVI